VLDLTERARSASGQANSASAASSSEESPGCCGCISSMSAIALLRTRLVLISFISIAVISMQLSSGIAAVSPALRSNAFLPFPADGVEDMLVAAQLVANLFGVWLLWVPLGVCGMNPPPATGSGTLIRAGSLSSTGSWRQKSLSRASSLDSRKKRSESVVESEAEAESPAAAGDLNVVLEMSQSFAAAAHAGDSDAPAPASLSARGSDSTESASNESAHNVQPSVHGEQQQGMDE
jgi:hypothetical protein